jgi:hypothetical protein
MGRSQSARADSAAVATFSSQVSTNILYATSKLCPGINLVSPYRTLQRLHNNLHGPQQD